MNKLLLPLLFMLGCSSNYPPHTLTIKGENWVVQVDSTLEDDGLDGQTNCDKRAIWYNPNENKQELRDTLWHEIFHAARCHLPDDQKAHWHESTLDAPEHHDVYLDAMFMGSFVHDNPEFMEWAENW